MKKEYLYLILSGLLYGTITSGGQFLVTLGLSLYEITFFRIFSILLLITPIIILKPSLFIKKANIQFFILYGLIGALLGLSTFGGLIYGVPVSIVALLLYTQPIWTIVLGKLLLNEKITLNKIISAITGIFAVLILFSFWNISFSGSYLGFLIPLFGGFLLSLWIIMGRKSGISNIHYLTTIFGWKLFTLLWLVLFYPVLNHITDDPDFIRLNYDFPDIYYLYFIIFALLGGLLPHMLFYRSVSYISASNALH